MAHPMVLAIPRRRALLCVGALVLSAVLRNGAAAADTFSVRCGEAAAGAQFDYTFDELRKRVIAYNFLGGRTVGLMYKGTIGLNTPDALQFDLVVAFNPTVRVGEFRLNRQEGWLTSSRSNYETKQTCEAIATRSVMDLWRLFESKQ